MPAHFNPEFDPADVNTDYGSTGGDITVPTFTADYSPFKFWCQKTLPLVFDDSLSYYEVLCKLVTYVNNLLTDLQTATGSIGTFAQQFVVNQQFLNNMAEQLGINTAQLESYINDRMEDFSEAYASLQEYVNTYFANLDVQEEINTKLDEMAQDGTLDTLLQPFTEDWLENMTEEIRTDLANQNQTLATQNSRISVLEGRMDTFAALPAGSTSGNAELLDIRTNFLGETFGSAGDAVRASDLIASGYIALPFTNLTGGTVDTATYAIDVSKYKGGRIAFIGNFFVNAPFFEYPAGTDSSIFRGNNSAKYSGSTKLLANSFEDFTYKIETEYAAADPSLPIQQQVRMMCSFTIPDDFSYQYLLVEGAQNGITGAILPYFIIYGTYWIETTIDPTLTQAGEAADAKATGDAISEVKEVLRNTVDTNIVLNSTFVQGGYGSINSYANPNPNSSTIRIRNEFSLVAKKIQIKVLDSDYAFAYAIFDSNGNDLSSRVVADVTDYTFAHNDIATIRVVLRHTDDSNITPDESLNIEIIVDDNPISFSVLSDDIKAVANNLQSLNYELNGKNYTNESEWIQGGYGSITSYADPNPNSSTARIRSEFVTNDGKTLKIHRDKEGYDFVYAVFDSNGNLLAGKIGWQSSAVDLAYDNIHMVRLSVRKSDNSNILSSDYEQSGIYIDSEGRLDELEKSNKSSLKLKVMTFNIGRFSYGVSPYYLSADYEEKLANYKRFFAQEKCDVVGLQEQNKYLDGASSGSILANDAIFDYLYPYHSDTDNWTCIKSKHALDGVGYGAFVSSSRTYSYATLNIDGKSIYLLCVHTTPNAGATQDALRAQEVAEIINLVSDKDYFIVFGDFNAQTTALFDSFTAEGYHIANGGYLPFEWTYSYNPADFSTDTPSDSIRYFDNIITSDNIIVDYSERLNVYADLSSDHIPFIAYLTLN